MSMNHSSRAIRAPVRGSALLMVKVLLLEQSRTVSGRAARRRPLLCQRRFVGPLMLEGRHAIRLVDQPLSGLETHWVSEALFLDSWRPRSPSGVLSRATLRRHAGSATGRRSTRPLAAPRPCSACDRPGRRLVAVGRGARARLRLQACVWVGRRRHRACRQRRAGDLPPMSPSEVADQRCPEWGRTGRCLRRPGPPRIQEQRFAYPLRLQDRPKVVESDHACRSHEPQPLEAPTGDQRSPTRSRPAAGPWWRKSVRDCSSSSTYGHQQRSTTADWGGNRAWSCGCRLMPARSLRPSNGLGPRS